ncbi:MAG: DUF502 domain-containing protein [Bacterioplanes sp.]|nr:DUF502 domain-containing protein [Bacterioplanes sp.]
MQRWLMKSFLKGAMVVLPLLITAWLLWSTLLWLNQIGLNALAWLGLHNSPIPGLGLILMLLSVLMVGLLFQFNPISWLYERIENTLLRFPIVRTLYGAIKDFAEMFDRDKQQNQPVVLVTLPGGTQAVGFITSQKLPDVLQKTGANNDPRVAVYLPMSYMVGGYTLIVAQSQLESLDWSFEDAMRFALTAGVSQSQAHSKTHSSDT